MATLTHRIFLTISSTLSMVALAAAQGAGGNSFVRVSGQQPAGAAPEIDPGLIGGGLVLLIGGLLILTARRRRVQPEA